MLIFRFSILLLVSLFLGCDPCFELAQQICDCKETTKEREACKLGLDSRGHQKSLERAEDKEMCSRILESGECTCLAIEENQLEKCGLVRMPNNQSQMAG